MADMDDNVLGAAVQRGGRPMTRDELFVVLACVGLAVLSVLAMVNYYCQEIER